MENEKTIDTQPPAKPEKPKRKPKKKKKNKAVAPKKTRPQPTPTTTPVQIGRGRPTDYDAANVEIVEKLCLLGATDAEIADFFGVTVRTVYRWKLEHEDFCQAMTAGKDLADNRIERSLFQRAAGYAYVEQQAFKLRHVEFDPQGKKVREYEDIRVVDVERQAPPDTTAGQFWLKNRRKEQWRDVQEKAYSGTVTLEEKPQQLGEDRLLELGSRFGRTLKVINGQG